MWLQFCWDGEDIILVVDSEECDDVVAAIKVARELGELIASESDAEAVVLEIFRAAYEGREPKFARSRLQDPGYWRKRLRTLLAEVEDLALEAAEDEPADGEEGDVVS